MKFEMPLNVSKRLQGVNFLLLQIVFLASKDWRRNTYITSVQEISGTASVKMANLRRVLKFWFLVFGFLGSRNTG